MHCCIHEYEDHIRGSNLGKGGSWVAALRVLTRRCFSESSHVCCEMTALDLDICERHRINVMHWKFLNFSAALQLAHPC